MREGWANWIGIYVELGGEGPGFIEKNISKKKKNKILPPEPGVGQPWYAPKVGVSLKPNQGNRAKWSLVGLSRISRRAMCLKECPGRGAPKKNLKNAQKGVNQSVMGVPKSSKGAREWAPIV